MDDVSDILDRCVEGPRRKEVGYFDEGEPVRVVCDRRERAQFLSRGKAAARYAGAISGLKDLSEGAEADVARGACDEDERCGRHGAVNFDRSSRRILSLDPVDFSCSAIYCCSVLMRVIWMSWSHFEAVHTHYIVVDMHCTVGITRCIACDVRQHYEYLSSQVLVISFHVTFYRNGNEYVNEGGVCWLSLDETKP